MGLSIVSVHPIPQHAAPTELILVTEAIMTTHDAKFLSCTVDSLCNNSFGYQEICPYIKLPLLKSTTAVRLQ